MLKIILYALGMAVIFILGYYVGSLKDREYDGTLSIKGKLDTPAVYLEVKANLVDIFNKGYATFKVETGGDIEDIVASETAPITKGGIKK